MDKGQKYDELVKFIKEFDLHCRNIEDTGFYERSKIWLGEMGND